MTDRIGVSIDGAADLTARFPELAAHGARVSVVATHVVDRMYPGDFELRRVIFATAHVHDIGKLSLSEAVLKKPASLTAEERFHIQHHAAIGANLLRGLGFPEELAMAVRHHHEWWNGSGYPDKRLAADIPLPSRVIAVADAVDAMTSNRPYRRALSTEAALRELSRCSGTQFDPEIVAVLLDVWSGLDTHPASTEQRTISAEIGREP